MRSRSSRSRIAPCTIADTTRGQSGRSGSCSSSTRMPSRSAGRCARRTAEPAASSAGSSSRGRCGRHSPTSPPVEPRGPGRTRPVPEGRRRDRGPPLHRDGHRAVLLYRVGDRVPPAEQAVSPVRRAGGNHRAPLPQMRLSLLDLPQLQVAAAAHPVVVAASTSTSPVTEWHSASRPGLSGVPATPHA
jgi:hypothetical protein